MTTPEAPIENMHEPRDIDVVHVSQAAHASALIEAQPPAPEVAATTTQQESSPSTLTDAQLRLIMKREAAQHIDDAFDDYFGQEELAALGITDKQFASIRTAAILAVAEFGVDVHNGDISYASVSLPEVPHLNNGVSDSGSRPDPITPPTIIRGEE